MNGRGASPPRSEVAEAQRVVLKLGTRILTQADGSLALSRLFAAVETVAAQWRAGKEVLLVTSGAVGLGKDVLRLEKPPAEIEERQACAAVGQSRLMGLYQQGFAAYGLVCGQVLLSQSDFDDRARYLSLRSTLQTLLRHRVVPILNENDAVSTAELAFLDARLRIFGDNDKLSALVASKLDADLLVLLTDVPGVFDKDPRQHPDARLLARIDAPGEVTIEAGGPGSSAGRGGMRSKVEAASIAIAGGCHAVIASGLDADALPRVLAGEDVGTWFPRRRRVDARRRWIAFAVAPRGALHLDAGAVAAVRERGSSLLAAGVRKVEGDFKRGDVVELRDPEGAVIGRGVVSCNRDTALRWCQGTPPLGSRNPHALIRRSGMFLEEI